MSLKCTPVKQGILCFIFLMYVATMRCFNYSGQESKNKQTNTQTSVVLYDSDTPVTLKRGKGQQTWYELVNPE